MTEKESYTRSNRITLISKWIARNGGGTRNEILRFILLTFGVSLDTATDYLREIVLRDNLEQEYLMGELSYKAPKAGAQGPPHGDTSVRTTKAKGHQ